VQSATLALAFAFALGVVAGPAMGAGPTVGPAQQAGAGIAAAPATDPASKAEPHIVEVYPNPTTEGDDGEFVTLWVPRGTDLDEYALADDHVSVSLPSLSNVSSASSDPPPSGSLPDRGQTVTFSTAPNATASLVDGPVYPLSDRLRLANGGDSLHLLRNGTVVDELRYERATETAVYDARNSTWRPLGATDFPVVTDGGGTVEAFVLPDEPDRAVELLREATERILLAGYTFSSRRIVDELLAAHDRGVHVEVLVDGSPVGGMSGHAAAALDELDRAGVTVRVLGGERARYRYHHAKYAVVDGRALVTTENWNAAGLGGKSSRGWAVVTDQERIVEGLVETYRADTGWVDAIPWSEYDDVALVDDDPAEGSHPSAFDAEVLPVERTRLLVAPDNAEGAILDAIESAEVSLALKQVRIGDRAFPLLQAVLDAAARGVDVRILLSGEWYVEEENEQLKAWLDEQASAEELSLQVRIADPDDEFEKIHAKGLVVDGETTLVGSINWNNNSVRSNREVALLLEGEEVASYFEAVFDSDWADDGNRTLPLGYVAVCLLGAAVAVVVAMQLRFEER